MILSDTIIENSSLFLKNLDKNSSASYRTASAGTYGIYSIPYSEPLIKDHIYYFRATYKFTTTNQSPTWVKIYHQGGYRSTNATISNPVAGTEYTFSGYATPTTGVMFTMHSGTIYNGPSGSISGCVSSVKNNIVYDVTYLYKALLGRGLVTSYVALVSWCDANLEWSSPNEYYDISALLDDIEKVAINKGSLTSDVVECDGMEYYSYSDALRTNTYFDEGSGLGIYNNKGNDTVTHERILASTIGGSPFYPEHQYVLKITTDGEASPSCGGFIASHVAAANKVFIERFVAKVPVGYNITSAFNSQGTGASVSYLTSRAGTGEWEEYAVLYECGSSGTFSSGGHIYLTPNSGYSATSVTWHVAYVNNCDITEDPSLKYYTALPKTDRMKEGKTFSYGFDTVNIFPNGDGSDTGMTLPSGWSFDTEDVAGNAKASFVQPVGATHGRDLGGELKVNPHYRYKVSMWVKCRRDMTSYLSAIYPFIDGASVQHKQVIYVAGTKTKLTAPLESGDTQMTVASNANWEDLTYGSAGFRSSQYVSSYNDLGNSHSAVSEGSISGVSGSTIVLFKSAYEGDTIPTGTVVVESRNGGNYPYPHSKAQLPTDNTWTYIEGYFGGDNVTWDGASDSNSWEALPSQCNFIKFAPNIYANTGTVPIKYADIRIEQVGMYDGERHEDKIQIKRYK